MFRDAVSFALSTEEDEARHVARMGEKYMHTGFW